MYNAMSIEPNRTTVVPYRPPVVLTHLRLESKPPEEPKSHKAV